MTDTLSAAFQKVGANKLCCSESDSFAVVFLLFQDIQTDAPFHLLHLKVEVERSKLMLSLQECQAELTRENRHLASMGSERLIKEHRVSTV